MGYRIFQDARGIEWQTWDVVPRLAERRVQERRSLAAQPPHTNRRLRTERRVTIGQRPALNAGLDGGWLCFEAQDERRRLAPIPHDWERCSLERLEQYCAQAPRAQRITQDLNVLKVSD